MGSFHTFELSEIWNALEILAANSVFKSKKVHLVPTKAYCSRCNSSIAWVILTNNKKHPVDWLGNGKNGNICYSREAQQWRILKSFELETYLRLGGIVFKSHFETCPFADEFRRKRK